MEADEDPDEPGLSHEERAGRRQRNQARRRERVRRERAREDAEDEVIDRELICEDDCDGFYDYVRDAFLQRVRCDLGMLKRYWERFLQDEGEAVMPAIEPPSIASQNPMRPGD